MSHGVCLFSCIPAKKEASHSSEMLTQLLFGERYRVLDQQGDWLKIETAYEQYPCFIHHKQHTPLSEKEFSELRKKESSEVYVKDVVQTLFKEDQQLHIPVTIGACLPGLSEGRFSIAGQNYQYEGHYARAGEKSKTAELLQSALLFLHAPYLWGGKTPFGLDCSGFTQLVFKTNGYKLPRDAWQQASLGEPRGFADEAEAGDLAFFDNEEGRIVHVGIVLNKTELIHASGSVRIDRYDHFGIYNSESKSYSHHLRVIKNYD